MNRSAHEMWRASFANLLLSKQRAYFYRGNKVVGVSVVSTDRTGYATPSGEFNVIEKDPTHTSSLYGDYVNRSGEP